MPVPMATKRWLFCTVAGAAQGRLPGGRGAHVVRDEHLQAGAGHGHLAQRHVAPAEVRRVQDDAAGLVDRPGDGDADARQGARAVPARPLGDEVVDQAHDRLQHGFGPLVRDRVPPVAQEQPAVAVGGAPFRLVPPTSTTATYESPPWARSRSALVTSSLLRIPAHRAL